MDGGLDELEPVNRKSARLGGARLLNLRSSSSRIFSDNLY